MRILLDTHTLIWWLNDPAELDPSLLDAISDEASDVFLSTASVWEAAIKEAAGKLTSPTRFEDGAIAIGVAQLPITWTHARRAAGLPRLHRDPFDRMIVAQAQHDDMVIATRDPLIRQYAVATIPA